MPIYMSLMIQGIEADGSVNQDHKGEINVLSFSWGASVPERKAGRGPANSAFEDLVIVKHVDRTSPVLMLACAQGKHFKGASFMVMPTDQTNLNRGNAMMLKIEDVVVQSVRQMGNENGDDFPIEEVTLGSAKVTSFVVGPAGDRIG